MFKRILVPLDGSALAEQALPHALELARCTGAQVCLVRVSLAEVYIVSPAGAAGLYTDEILKRDREAAEAYLATQKARVAEAGIPVTTEALTGPVAETIIDYARETHADLIVMSTHGRSGLGRWVYGSVTDKVLRGAHCPTLIVRGQTRA